jgi:hypothetical protein
LVFSRMASLPAPAFGGHCHSLFGLRNASDFAKTRGQR